MKRYQNQSKFMIYYRLVALIFVILNFLQCEMPKKDETYYLSESEKESIPYKLNEKLTMYSDNDTLNYIVAQDTIQISFIANPLVTYWSEERFLLLNNTIPYFLIYNLGFQKKDQHFHIDFAIFGDHFFFSVDVFEPFANSTSNVREEVGSITINGKDYNVHLFKYVYNEPQSFLDLNKQYGLISFEHGNDMYYFKYG